MLRLGRLEASRGDLLLAATNRRWVRPTIGEGSAQVFDGLDASNELVEDLSLELDSESDFSDIGVALDLALAEF